jgi:GntR family transcriptional regulator
MARDLRINPNTVARAYRELEVDGIVYKRGSVGTFVAKNPPILTLNEDLIALQKPIDELLRVARVHNLPVDQVIHLLREYEARTKTDAEEGQAND